MTRGLRVHMLWCKMTIFDILWDAKDDVGFVCFISRFLGVYMFLFGVCSCILSVRNVNDLYSSCLPLIYMHYSKNK